MKKYGLLQDFYRNTTTRFLAIDAVRLYMLLIACAPETGAGKVSQKKIRKTLGESLSADTLKKICLSLEEIRLIRFYNLPPEPTLVYRLPFAE